MEAINASFQDGGSSTQIRRTSSFRSRYSAWFRKSKSETDKELWHRGGARPVSCGAVAATASSHAVSLSSSTSSTAASAAYRRTDTISSSSSHEIASSRPVKHVAVQCTLLAGDCTAVTSLCTGCDVTTMTSHAGCDVTTLLAGDCTAVTSLCTGCDVTTTDEKVSSGGGGMCVEMDAVLVSKLVSK